MPLQTHLNTVQTECLEKLLTNGHTAPAPSPYAHRSEISKTKKLRKLLFSSNLEFLMEAHNGLSARIVEEAGFKGIWASGLTISAQLGVRDNNEASWTQVLEVVEFMSDAAGIPILLDGDTGYGNFNNVRRLVRKLEQRGVAGVCIEDKLFPKMNSFIKGEEQMLADIDEFCGRIKAGKDAQTDPDFCLVARTEAFIAGLGLDEALRRAEAYAEAGADAVLIHSKQSKPTEILHFMESFRLRVPVVIVPTKYYSTPTDVFRKAGVSLVVWANQLLRACVTTMKGVTAQIRREESLTGIEDMIAPISEVFRLQGADELLAAEERYLPSAAAHTNAVILAASRGEELADLTKDRPKCMVPINGKPILQRVAEDLRSLLIKDISVVAGYKAGAVSLPGIRVIENKEYEKTKDLASLKLALDRLNGSTFISYGDILVRKYILHNLLERCEDVVIVVDSEVRSAGHADALNRDMVTCSHMDDNGVLDESVTLSKARPSAGDLLHGEWIGLMKISSRGTQWIRQAFERLETRSDFAHLEIRDLLDDLIGQGHTVYVLYVRGHWINVNGLVDVSSAASFVRKI